MSIYVWTSEIKNIYVWTTPVKEVYVGTTKIRPTAQPITTAWIYWSSDLWLISLSTNGSTWTTIADKNLWATSTDISSSNSYGNYYQRWNNYGFPTTWTVTTSATQVNASTYWPWNYYSSSTFITTSPRDSSGNTNLWWDTTGTVAAKQWPCPTGFHVASLSEWTALISLMTSLWYTTKEQYWTYLKIPLSWWRRNTWATWIQWVWVMQWTATSWTAIRNDNYSNIGTVNYQNELGLPIRPFKNTATQPDTSRTKLN